MNTTKIRRPALILAAVLTLAGTACEVGGYEQALEVNSHEQAPAKHKAERKDFNAEAAEG